MLRWAVVCVIFFITTRQIFAKYETDMQSKTEKERQTTKIKDTIRKELKNNKIGTSKFDEGVGTSSHKKSVISVPSKPVVPTAKPHVITAQKQILSLGEPLASKKNDCLVFKIEKDKQQILLHQLQLWVHIQKLKKADGKTNKVKMKHKRAADNKVCNTTKTPLKGDKKKKQEKKQLKKDRKITIFVSDGCRVLAKVRRLIKVTGWYKINLPISKLAEVIRANDSLQLCFECKQCSKTVKLDLFSLPVEHTKVNETKISFIVGSSLPQNDRHKRSGDAHNKNHTNFDVNISRHSCCKEIVHTEKMSSLSPSIFYPSSVNISYCETIFKDAVLYKKRQSVSLSSTKEDIGEVICLPREYKSLSMLIFDRSLNIKDVIF